MQQLPARASMRGVGVLTPLFGVAPLTLLEGARTLGRCRELKVNSPAISRQHCTIQCKVDRHGLPSVYLEPLKRVYLQRVGDASPPAAIKPGVKVQVSSGDTLYLGFDGSTYQYGFRVDLAQQSMPSVSQSEPPVSPAPTPPKRPAVGDSGSEPGPPGPHHQLFDACRLVFWVRNHTAALRGKAVAAGAAVQECLDAATTHVIAKRHVTASEAAEKLAEVSDRLETMLLQYEGQQLQVPSRVHFVTQQWLVDCLAQSHRLPELHYRTSLQVARDAASAALEAAAADGSQASAAAAASEAELPTQPEQELSQQHSQEPEQPAQLAGAAVELAVASTEQERPAAATAGVAASAGVPPAVMPAGGIDSGRAEVEEAVVMPGSPSTAQDPVAAIYDAAQRRAAAAGQPVVTGGDSGVPWGLDDVWVEPWNLRDAQRTLKLVELNWYGKTEEGSAMEEDVASASDGDSAAAKPAGNGVCEHPACSEGAVCIVAELQTAKEGYVGTDKAAQFKIKALDRAISQVAGLKRPLRGKADVEALGLGAKTSAKLTEIVETGALARNKAQAQDEQLKVIGLFTQVWGAASATAAKWYREGARTLQDLASRTDLTEQQKVGLKYFDDFQHKIPASEVAAVEALLQAEVAAMPGCADRRTFAHVTGSYMRGKPATGDIDILIIPAPTAFPEGRPVHVGPWLQQLLGRLLARGLVVEEMAPRAARTDRAEHAASWMGVARPAGSPYHRRIDIKVYPPSVQTYAINFFTGSGPFVRALRHWARTRCGERAAAVAPGATGFKLSDYVLLPTSRKRKRDGQEAEEKEMPPGVGCSCETDIFRMLGLEYVPPRMRFFSKTEYK